MESERRTVDVIIPSYRPGDKFLRLLNMLSVQSYPVRKIIVMNTEKSFWKEEEFSGILNLEVHHLKKEEFDHGATRNKGASYSSADVMVFMTDGAVPADRFLLENLMEGFVKEGADGEPVCAVYARQLPNPNCDLAEQYTRRFNYPDKELIKTKRDIPAMGIKTFFASNVCCAYDRKMFFQSGGFINRTIFNEDMIYAGRAIKERGWAVVYKPEAQVYHSHNYGCIAQFKRNFDLAVSQADHPEVFQGIRSESEGIRLVKSTAAWLAGQGKLWMIPGLIVKSGFKYMGYLAGKRYRRLRKKAVMAFTMNREYWKKADI